MTEKNLFCPMTMDHWAIAALDPRVKVNQVRLPCDLSTLTVPSSRMRI
jgi:hypothetical protein